MVSNMSEENKTDCVACEPSKENPMHMESVQRIAKLPCVESTINAATNVYEKVKDSNSMINWTLTTAESVGHQAIDTITPLANQVAPHLEGPIKKVDAMLCTGLNYVEEKIPCVKKQPSELVENTKDYFNNTVTPAIQTARVVMQPAVEGACAVRDYGVLKVEEYLGKKPDADTEQKLLENFAVLRLVNYILNMAFQYNIFRFVSQIVHREKPESKEVWFDKQEILRLRNRTKAKLQELRDRRRK